MVLPASQSGTTSLWDVEAAPSLKACLLNFEGSFSVASPRETAPPATLICYPKMVQQHHVVSVNDQTGTPQALACAFFRNAEVYGCGNVLIDGRLLIEEVESSRVAAAWHTETQASLPDRETVNVSNPAISFVGPGHRVYGHWLVEFIPRLMVAVTILGESIRDFEVLLPSDTPDFAVRLCSMFFGPLNYRMYDSQRVILRCERLCVPSFPLSAAHHFHNRVKLLFDSRRPDKPGTRKYCISRRRIEGKTAGTVKDFKQRDLFEELAKCYGYELLFPEEFALSEQLDLFSDAKVIVGEFGSAFHNSMFSGPGVIVGATGFFNSIQLRLSALNEQESIYAVPEEQDIVDGLIRYSCSPNQLVGFFEAIEERLRDKEGSGGL